MKKLMMALALVVITAGAKAQNEREMTPDERAKARTTRMTRELGLNAEQTARVEALNRKYAEEAQVGRLRQDAEREQRRAAMKERHERYEGDLKSVLTPEQFEQWRVKKEEMKAKHRGKRKATHGERKEVKQEMQK